MSAHHAGREANRPCGERACRAIALTGLLAIAAATGAPDAAAQTPVRASATLEPGDLVRIIVWRSEELSGDFEIAADGTIRHPLYRSVTAAGVPLDMLEQRLRTLLSRFDAQPQFVIEPRLRVAISGEVREPNLFSLSPELSIAQAIALAGGPTERGRLDQVRLLRDGREIILDLTRPASYGAMRIRSGDQIVVPRRKDTFRDTVAPIAAVTGAAAAVLNVILRSARDR